MTPLRARGAQAVADAWNADVPARYRIDAKLVERNLLDHPLLHEEASGWEGDAFVAVKRSAASLYEGPDPKVAHLALFGNDAPVEAAIARLLADGYDAVVVGADSGHFLPGAPTDVPWLGLFLKAHGFVPGGLVFDLERDLADFVPMPPGPRDRYRTVEDEDVAALDAFLLREFPGRWRYDVMRKVEAEGPSTAFGMFDGEGCHGFALLQSEGCARPIGGAVWQADLGPRWGSLGPIGISGTIRGAGVGRSFLNHALAELRSRGARRTIIDWTGLVDFYGTQGFSVARTYRSYRRSLREDRPPSA